MLLMSLLITWNCFGKKVDSKEDNSPTVKIKNDITALCSAPFEGRLAGTQGESLSADYIQKRFEEMNIAAYKNKYQWDFNFKGGVRIGSNAYFKVFENKLILGTDVVFLPFGKGNELRGSAMPNVNEPDNIWLIPISKLKLNTTNNPQKILHEYAAQCASKSATGVLFLNDQDASLDLSMLNLNSFEPLSIPVAFMNAKAYQTHIKPNLKSDWIDIDGKLGFENTNVLSKNVIASVDNKAPFNIVIAAHYDHLGNSGQLYKGADNNASGIAALLGVAEMVKMYNLKRFNYIFVAFSGHMADMQGTKAFIQQNEFMLNNISCMINLDQVGRYDNNKKELFINGIGTSPTWLPLVQKTNKGFVLQIDSSGLGYGDYNLFYYKNIPVLNVSTGFNDDYNRVSDDESKINYNGIFEITAYVYRMLAELDKQTKLIFNQTKNIFPELNKLKSDIGIVHDLTFNQNGCRVATTLPGSKVANAGMLSGDIILKIGAFNIIDFDDFIEAMTKTKPGIETTFIVKRGKTDYKFFVVL
jgi:aminopeptidase YwaD